MKIKNLLTSFLNFIWAIFKSKKMIIQKEYVWYVGYGSNLFRERFHYYILGGKAPGSDDEHPGCTDRTLPVQESPYIINHDLYFARRSSKWQNGGMGFVRIESDPTIQTFCNMYLITKNQFLEVVQQENKNDTSIVIDFDTAIENGSLIFKTGGTYGNLLFVGYKDNYPIFTFSNEINVTPFRRPSELYLKMIVTGLLETHHLNRQQVVDYLVLKEGVRNNYTPDQLAAIFYSIGPGNDPKNVK